MELLVLLLILIIWYLCTIYKYRKSTYYTTTKLPYLKVRFDIGLNGEYLTYKKLQSYEKRNAKFLFNCYLPKRDGTTTEIDVMLIDTSGIYVFESKNYSGWIFGKETAKTWTQTLPQGRGKKAHKEQFLNPIFQNKLHIRCLQEVLEKETLIHSVVVFSERCTFKNVDVQNNIVIKRSDLSIVVKKIALKYKDSLTPDEVKMLYEKLYPYTQVTEQVKRNHVTSIKEKEMGEPVIEDASDQDSSGQALTSCAPTDIQESGSNIKHEVTEIQSKRGEYICPMCGSELVLRTAKRGENKGQNFYGCSNFPKCRYTQTSKQQEDGFINDTLQYYNHQARQFSKDTVDVKFTETQNKFLGYLKSDARILDYGCGAGRDTKYFLEKGHQIDAIDGSEELVKIASECTQIVVKQMLFQDLDVEKSYDGIWACASILHLPYKDLIDVFVKMEKALTAQGIVYTSFKYGTEEVNRKGRYFTDMTEDKMKTLLASINLFMIEEMWVTSDVRPEREDERWLNVILRKMN